MILAFHIAQNFLFRRVRIESVMRNFLFASMLLRSSILSMRIPCAIKASFGLCCWETGITNRQAFALFSSRNVAARKVFKGLSGYLTHELIFNSL